MKKQVSKPTNQLKNPASSQFSTNDLQFITAEHIAFISACQEESLDTFLVYDSSQAQTAADRQQRRRAATKDLNLLYKSQANKNITSSEEFDRKCERIKKYLHELKLGKSAEANVAPASIAKKRFLPPLKLVPFLSLSIFRSNKK